MFISLSIFQKIDFYIKVYVMIQALFYNIMEQLCIKYISFNMKMIQLKGDNIMSTTGCVTIPTDVGIDKEMQEIIRRWGADAIRDCDGT